jgi:hypothetical protein
LPTPPPTASSQLANFGAEAAIGEVRAELAAVLKARRADLLARNAERDPMKVLGPVLLASGVAVAAWVMRQLIELTCAPWLDVCRRGSQMFAFVYSAILVALVGLAYLHRAAVGRYTAVLAPVGKQVAALASSALHSALDASGGSGGGSGGSASRRRPATAPAALHGGGGGGGDTAAAAVEYGDDGAVDAAAVGGDDSEPSNVTSGGLAASAGVRRRARRA